MKLDYDKGCRGAGGKASLFIDAKKVGEGRIGRTHPNVFTLDDTGVDTGTPVDDSYREGK